MTKSRDREGTITQENFFQTDVVLVSEKHFDFGIRMKLLSAENLTLTAISSVLTLWTMVNLLPINISFSFCFKYVC